MQLKNILCGSIIALTLPIVAVQWPEDLYNNGKAAIQNNDFATAKKAIADLKAMVITSKQRTGPQQRLNGFIQDLQAQLDAKNKEASSPLPAPVQSAPVQSAPVQPAEPERSEQKEDNALQRQLAQQQARNEALQEELTGAHQKIVELETTINATVKELAAKVDNDRQRITHKLGEMENKVKELAEQLERLNN